MPCHCSSVLPLPFAFSRAGVVLGIATMLVVGFCNAHTCALLLKAAGTTGHDSYEGVAEAIGGKPWKARQQLTQALLADASVRRFTEDRDVRSDTNQNLICSCRCLQVITQISLFLLLFGTLCGDFALLHDASLRAVNKLWLGSPPGQLERDPTFAGFSSADGMLKPTSCRP